VKSNLILKPNEIEIRNLNALPVPTWRWLNVNSFKLKDLKTPEIPKFNKEFLMSSFDGITINKMDSSTKVHDNIKYYINNKEAYGVEEGLTILGEKHYNSGVFIHVPRGFKAAGPVRLEYLLDFENPVVVDNNIITAEENSEITVVIDYSTSGGIEAFHNGITKVYARAGAVVNIVKVQRLSDISFHFDASVAFTGQGARVNWVEVNLGAKASVTNITSNLDEDGSESSISSIYFGDGERSIDIKYLINHRGRRSISSIETKGALKDKSRKVFKGTIDFKNGAGRSKGSEEEFALLLDRTVKASSVPLLLCSEDDVDGQHAASAGQIDDEKLFYIMSRGFSEKEAKKLVVEASFSPVIDKIPCEDLRGKIRDDVKRRLLDA
jgi:FeS assembly protein SufD